MTTLPHFLSHYAIYVPILIFKKCPCNGVCPMSLANYIGTLRLKVITGFRLNHLYVVFPNQWVLARDLHLKRCHPLNPPPVYLRTRQSHFIGGNTKGGSRIPEGVWGRGGSWHDIMQVQKRCSIACTREVFPSRSEG